MALHLEILQNLSGYSLAKYSTWIYYTPDNILFDCGEGVSIAMRNRVYAVDKIFLSHSHGDHISGIVGFLWSRASSMGDQKKPLTIYHPKGDRNIVKLQQYIQSSLGEPPYPLEWKVLEAGEKVKLHETRTLETFETDHHASSLTLGYKVLEHRTRLKKKYRDLSPQELKEYIKSHGKEGLTENYDCTLLCYSGDSMPLNSETAKDAQVLLHDATFLSEKDREEKTHATIREAIQVAVKSKVSLLGLFHFSARYGRQNLIQEIQGQMEKLRVKFPVFYLLPYSSAFTFKEIVLEEFDGKTQ
jgi:ribonuclease Z